MFTVLAIEIQFNNGLKEKLPLCQFPLVCTALLGAVCVNANVLFVLFRKRSNLNMRHTGRRRDEALWEKVNEQGLKTQS